MVWWLPLFCYMVMSDKSLDRVVAVLMLLSSLIFYILAARVVVVGIYHHD